MLLLFKQHAYNAVESLFLVEAYRDTPNAKRLLALILISVGMEQGSCQGPCSIHTETSYGIRIKLWPFSIFENNQRIMFNQAIYRPRSEAGHCCDSSLCYMQRFPRKVSQSIVILALFLWKAFQYIECKESARILTDISMSEYDAAR